MQVGTFASHTVENFEKVLRRTGDPIKACTNHLIAFANKIERQAANGYAARFLRPTGFIEFSGARDPEIGRRLAAAFRRDRGIPVQSLRRAPEEPDETCWLAGDGWWLSTESVDGNQVA